MGPGQWAFDTDGSGRVWILYPSEGGERLQERAGSVCCIGAAVERLARGAKPGQNRATDKGASSARGYAAVRFRLRIRYTEPPSKQSTIVAGSGAGTIWNV